MPELPEVETIVRQLEGRITGKTIANVDVRLKKVAISPGLRPFANEVVGERIERVGRRGKFVVMELASGRSIVVHLRMTGRLIVQKQADLDFPYTNVALGFSDRSRLSFADVRQFGRMRLVERNEHWDADVGLEPLSPEFTPAWLAMTLLNRRMPVKVLLLDQKTIAGIGNIYACEALWWAKIKPSRLSRTLNRGQAERLHGAIRDVLLRAIDLRGSSIDDYVDSEGLPGEFQRELTVYGREGEPCRTCERPIVRTVLGQRGTWWCKFCQK